MKFLRHTTITAVLVAHLALSLSVHAQGQSPAVDRTVEFRIGAEMRITPDHVDVRQGQKVRLVLRNDSRQQLEFALGTREALIEHAAQMLKLPDMTHDQAYVARVAPGKTDTLVWTFDRAGDFEVACLIAGHFEHGMVAKIKVVAVDGIKGDGLTDRKR